MKKIGKNGIDLGKRGVYDKRNVLNDLTGKEWIYFTNSVWITGYSPTSLDNVGLKYRKIHPSPKPPGLLKDIILFFTKEDGVILDPFAGVGGTLLGASLAGGKRKAFGIDLNSDYKKAYVKTCKAENLKEMTFNIGDSLLLLSKKNNITKNEYDLIIADPPYSDMMNKKKTGQKVKLYKDSSPTPYSNSDNDIGNLEKKDFLAVLNKIMTKSVKLLKQKKYLIVFCKDFQPQVDQPNLLHCDIINSISKIKGLQYKGMRIWHDQAMSLYPFGYPFSFVMNQLHQYILVFRKE